jgi:hypothetical protein
MAIKVGFAFREVLFPKKRERMAVKNELRRVWKNEVVA